MTSEGGKLPWTGPFSFMAQMTIKAGAKLKMEILRPYALRCDRLEMFHVHGLPAS